MRVCQDGVAAGDKQRVAPNQGHRIDIIVDRQARGLPDIGHADPLFIAEPAQLRIGKRGTGTSQSRQEPGQCRWPDPVIGIQHEQVRLAAPGNAGITRH